MKLVLFGWLLKPALEVSFLDRITGYAEFAVLLFIVVMFLAYREAVANERRRKRGIR